MMENNFVNGEIMYSNEPIVINNNYEFIEEPNAINNNFDFIVDNLRNH